MVNIMTDFNKNSNSRKNKSQLMQATIAKLSKNDLARRDIFGRTILHLLILTNRHDLLKHLLKNPDARCVLNLVDYENGWNCMHYVIFHKRLSCFKVLIEYLKSNTNTGTTVSNNSLLFELLRCQDRNKVTPLQLLDNDFKDLIWVPEYINEKNEYHLTYRFQTSHENTKHSSGSSGEGNAEDPQKKSRIRQSHQWWSSRRGGSDVYMFGSNKNNNLGVGDSTDRATPSKISQQYFKDWGAEENNIQDKLSKPRYKMVKISKNHSIILTQEGRLYSCGIGARGRLGHGFDDLNNTFRFRNIDFFEGTENDEDVGTNRHIIRDVAVSSNHSIALSTKNEVFTWGLNNYNQLGYTSTIASSSNSSSYKSFLEPFEGLPREVIAGDLKKNNNFIRGVTVSKIHSVTYTKNELFFWGLCIGQMGISIDPNASTVEHKVNNSTYRGFVQRSPRRIILREDIKHVLTSETCTCVITTTNDIHIYYQFQHFKLPKIPVKGYSDKHFHLFKPTKLTQAINIKKVSLKSHLFIALLLESGDVVSFSLSQPETDEGLSKAFRNMKYASIWKSYDRDMKVIDMDVSNDGSIVLCTRNGSAFIKTNSGQRKKSMSDATLPTLTSKNKFKKLDNLNKIVAVTCDDTFLSFGFVRDDIDMIPFKLHMNEVFKDMDYLSYLSESDMYRKQDQLLGVDQKKISYIADFLLPSNSTEVENVYGFNDSNFDNYVREDEDEIEVQDNEETDILNEKLNDILHDRYINRYDFLKYKRVKKKNIYESLSRLDEEPHINLLKSDMRYIVYKLSMDESNKNYDCLIKFEDFPDLSIGFHKELYIKRSPFCAKIFKPLNPGEYFIQEGLEGRYCPELNELVFSSQVNIKSVLILNHFMYTNRVLAIWEDFPSGLNCPKEIKEIKSDFDKLTKVFLVSDLFGKFTKDEVFLKKIRSLIDNEGEGDIIVNLKDGDMVCHSYILLARSAFFETILSDRWEIDKIHNGKKILNFEDLSIFQFELILRHLYGYNDFQLFDCFKQYINQAADVDEFINYLLELIEISDELLLFQLKSLCQLGIKDLITLENVLILLTHSEYLSATKLFMNCCWFIYNNLDIILLDPSFCDILDSILKKLEQQINFFQFCKLRDFSDDQGNLNAKYLDNWMTEQSNSLIHNFLNNSNDYNDVFISDKKGYLGFQPLIDIKYDQKKGLSEGSKKKKERRSQSSISRKDSSLSEVRHSILDFRKNASPRYNDNEEALVDEDGFEPVANKRRQNSKTEDIKNGIASASPASPSSQLPSRNSSIIDVPQTPSARKISLSSLSIKSNKPNNEVNSTQAPGLSAHSTCAANSNGTVPSEKQPILGKSTESDSIDSPLNQKKIAKAKIGPSMRLSQKERKKMASHPHADNSSNEDLKTINPWKRSNSNSESINGASSSLDLPVLGTGTKKENQPIRKISSTRKKSLIKSSELPVLGNNGQLEGLGGAANKSTQAKVSVKPNFNKPVNKVYSTPSLSEIMIHESLKIEETKIRESERRSLQEIQQEQQFAKWWEEEAAKVQNQMQQFSLREERSLQNPKENRSKKNKGNKGKSLGPRNKNPDVRNDKT